MNICIRWIHITLLNVSYDKIIVVIEVGQKRFYTFNTTESTKIKPVCERSTCPELAAPQYGRLSCTEGIRIGSQCTTTCLEGYRIQGLERTECLINERWSNALPRCELVRCPLLQIELSPHLKMDCSEGNIYRKWYKFFSIRLLDTSNLLKFHIILENNIFCIFIRSSCSFSCDVGWELRGKDTLECNANGQWTGNVPYCQEITCGKLAAPAHGSIQCTSRDRYNSKCRYDCEPGYELIGAQVSFIVNLD